MAAPLPSPNESTWGPCPPPTPTGESTSCRSLGGWEGQRAESGLSGSPPSPGKAVDAPVGMSEIQNYRPAPDLQNLHFNKPLRQCIGTHNVRSSEGEQQDWEKLAALNLKKQKRGGGPPFFSLTLQNVQNSLFSQILTFGRYSCREA